ncbi:hypothetical protein J6590_022694 [Homalodisca vitripennis]|nr:hypothetical protein J6590_022694 [Homalodisca vitripennis]
MYMVSEKSHYERTECTRTTELGSLSSQWVARHTPSGRNVYYTLPAASNTIPVNTLVKLDLCRCTSKLLKQIAAICPQLEYIAAETMKNSQINMTNLGNCQNLIELNLRGLAGITVINVSLLTNLTKLKKLSLIEVKNTSEVLEVVGKMTQLESLELGDMINVTETHVIQGFSQLTKLKRLRLEKGQQDCPTNAIIHTISKLPCLNHLELINFDIKEGFDASLNKCSNISKLLLVPTYTSQVTNYYNSHINLHCRQQVLHKGVCHRQCVGHGARHLACKCALINFPSKRHSTIIL